MQVFNRLVCSGRILIACLAITALTGCSEEKGAEPRQTTTINYRVRTQGTPGDGTNCNAYLMYHQNAKWLCGGWCQRGFNIVTINPVTGEVARPWMNFDTWMLNSDKEKLLDSLRAIPDGLVMLVAICDDAGFKNRLSDPVLNEQVRVAFEALGSVRIRDYVFRDSWAFVVKKGTLPPIGEAFAKNGEFVELNYSVVIEE